MAKPAGQTSCASEQEETGLLLQITTMQSMARAIKKVISATQIIWVIHSALAHILLMCEAPPGVCVKTSGWNVVPFPPTDTPRRPELGLSPVNIFFPLLGGTIQGSTTQCENDVDVCSHCPVLFEMPSSSRRIVHAWDSTHGSTRPPTIRSSGK